MKLSKMVSVRLENFQSHLDTMVSLSKGLNVVVGQSDSGKTAVLRGVRWALFNQPRGTDFLKVGADFVRVTIEFENGHTLVRERTSSKNRYIIKKKGQDDLVLEGFGSSVPEEVLNAHQMRPFRIDADHEWQLQIAQQLEGPFLLEQTGSIRAKTIGRMSGAHYLDMAIRDTSKDVSQLTQRVKWKEQELEAAAKELEPFKPLDQAKQQLDEGFRLLERVKEHAQKVQVLKRLSEQFKQLNGQKSQLDQTIRKVKDLNTWELLFLKLQQLTAKRYQLSSVQSEWQRISKDLSTCQTWLTKTESIDEVDQLAKALANKVTQTLHLQRLKKNKENVTENIAALKGHLERTHFLQSFNEEHVTDLRKKVMKTQQLRERLEWLQKTTDEENELLKRKQLAHTVLQAYPLAESVSQTFERTQVLSRYQEKITLLKKRLEEGAAFVAHSKQQEQEQVARYTEALSALNLCPTCGQPIKQKEESK
ncbi:AAA family ATPase [Shouchella hunanensis]|uniref:Nuclease SbcCD subunit C n=1 Tax=Shouchella hunanensis TaxID=766894 RepID=A0ABY7WBC4_9BACI|nr:AAA family ATPase [Shouchella hunanensis]WDF05976.1 AAA family ATPase [Shouchella hunanensis]